tara:strand:+ start:511 stop:1194 length:684 start_codon:yes stop_codon:yes gene_type:complete
MLDELGNIVSGAGTGFAFGGPIGAIGGGLLGYLTSMNKPEQEVISEQKIQDLLRPSQQYADDFKQRSEDLWDPSSGFNIRMRNDFLSNALNNSAQSSMLANRNMAGAGISNPAMQNTMLGNFNQQGTDMANTSFKDAFRGNMDLSSQLFSEAANQQMGIGDAKINAYLGRMGQENTLAADQYNSLTGGVTSGLNMLAGIKPPGIDPDTGLPTGGSNTLGIWNPWKKQ